MGRAGHLVLVVGPGSPVIGALPDTIDSLGISFLKPINLDSAFRLLKRKGLRMVILCLDVLKTEGLSFLSKLKCIRPEVDVMVVNHPKDIQLSVEAVKMGVLGEFLLPIDIGQLIDSIKRALSIKERVGQWERSFAAIAFLEEGDRDSAMGILNSPYKDTK